MFEHALTPACRRVAPAWTAPAAPGLLPSNTEQTEPAALKAGGPGFLGWPVNLCLPEAARASQAHQAPDVVLIGVPLSEPYAGPSDPNDQARAPDAIRAQSHQIWDGPEHWDFDLGAAWSECLPPRCEDRGNWLPAAGRSGPGFERFLQEAANAMAELFAAGTQVLVLGGDHGASIPVLMALQGLGRPVHVLHIDAHLDWRDEVGGVRHGYSSPLKRASEMPWISGMTQVGLRGTGSARRTEWEAAQAWGSRCFSARQVHDSGVQAVINTLPDGADVYITIDADGLDPSLMPAVMAPAPGGLRFEQVAALIAGAGQRGRIVGMDVVEVAPAYDLANQQTCITAGRLLLQALAATWGPGEQRLRIQRSPKD